MKEETDEFAFARTMVNFTTKSNSQIAPVSPIIKPNP
jgi:hypothetical protein